MVQPAMISRVPLQTRHTRWRKREKGKKQERGILRIQKTKEKDIFQRTNFLLAGNVVELINICKYKKFYFLRKCFEIQFVVILTGMVSVIVLQKTPSTTASWSTQDRNWSVLKLLPPLSLSPCHKFHKLKPPPCHLWNANPLLHAWSNPCKMRGATCCFRTTTM